MQNKQELTKEQEELKNKLTGFYVSGKDHPADMYSADDLLFSLVSELISKAKEEAFKLGYRKSKLSKKMFKTIHRKDLAKHFSIILKPGYACPRCLLESWVTSEDTIEMEKGWCRSCAFSGEPLKIIDK